MNELRKQVETKQKWNGQELYFDPDSSPKAWEHYKKVYHGELWDKYKIGEPCFFEYVKRDYYADTPKSYYNRLMALPKENVEMVDVNKGANCYRSIQRLGGETDFNFDEKKYEHYLKILYKNFDDKEDYEKNKKILDTCAYMQHTLLNFSLMPILGDMQRAKRIGVYGDERLDSLIYLLDVYYTIVDEDENVQKKKRMSSGVVKAGNAGTGSRIEFQIYLDNFSSVHDYCKRVHFLEDEEFIKKLIHFGKEKIETAADVILYMQLAQEFWDKKEAAIKNLINS